MQLSDRIGRRMKLQDLHVLMTVAHARTMGKAAQLLNTTQPNVSRMIAELEHALGVRLLDRHRHGIEPTEYGRALLDCGVAVFDDLRQFVKRIEFLTNPTAGDVRIGCSNSLALTFVSAVIENLSRRYPQITFHLVTAHVEGLYRELSERNVDLLIARRTGLFGEEDFDFENLYDDSYVVAVGARSPWSRKRRIALADLVDESWLLPPPDRALGPNYLQAFRACGLDYPRTVVFTVPPEVRLNLLGTGRFLTIVPTSVLRFSDGPETKVLPIELSMARAPVGVVTLKNRTLSPTAKLFIDGAREVAKLTGKGKPSHTAPGLSGLPAKATLGLKIGR
jgi:DNA-binding transcriptional LysR family regulator